MEHGVFVGLGGNLPTLPWGSPRRVLIAAVDALSAEPGLQVLRLSRWYRSPPVPPSPQPWFVNGVVELACELSPAALLARLHELEARFGRVRHVRNEARSLDLDLLAYGERISDPSDAPALPHPRLHQRAFVLAPLCDLAPAWRHPRLRRSAAELLAALPADAAAFPLIAGDDAI